ncbi:CocE/NonD family hydrolase [Rhodococcus sp. NPDC055112]
MLTAAAWVVPTGTAAADPAGFSKQTLHFDVRVGPDGSQRCDVIGDLYTPTSASADHRVPAALTTNGFGGSKDQQAGMAGMLASRGYAVLSYSGLGFGGSGCKVSLDSPDYDGKAAAALVSFLGGADGIAYADAAYTTPVAGLDYVLADVVANDGKPAEHDPRVGMFGGSYGGAVQFAAAATDPRIDTIIPMITWNDISYSLAPNSTDFASGVSSRTPGAAKTSWAMLFSAAGATGPGAAGYQADPARALPCPNFLDVVCPALVQAMTAGFAEPALVDSLRGSSVASYVDRIKIPVLLTQGQRDTLFNLNEAEATFDALKAQGNDVKMIWHTWGHSGLTAAPGEYDPKNPDPEAQYQTGRILDWLDHHLKGSDVDTGPVFSYFRDWVDYDGNAAPAYASASDPAVGQGRSFFLSNASQLTPDRGGIAPGAQSLFTPAGGLATSTGVTSLMKISDGPETEVAGTVASWTSGPMGDPMDVVGAPKLSVRVSTAPGLSGGVADSAVVFVKLYDVAPDGAATLINANVAPVRILDQSKPVDVTLPAIVHRFAPGHSVRLAIAGGDGSFRGGLVPHQITVSTGDPGQQLVLPVVGD